MKTKTKNVNQINHEYIKDHVNADNNKSREKTN